METCEVSCEGTVRDHPELEYFIESSTGDDILYNLFSRQHKDWIGKRIRMTIQKVEAT